MKIRALLSWLIPAATFAFTGQAIYIPPATQSIASITCSPCSFTGGTDAANIGVTVNLSPASPPFNGTLAIVGGTLNGSGNDANSFQVSSGQVMSHAAGGTIQPGQYGIVVKASSGATTYTNSVTQSFVVQATGAGGSGWDLTFSDEFGTAKGPSGAYMLDWQNQQTPTSITWATGSGVCSPGCGTVVLPSHGSLIIRAGQTVSITGATNGGSGGNSAINTNFAVSSVTDDEHFVIYMPASAGVFGTIGVSGATIGTGPWVNSIVVSNSCGSAGCLNPTMEYTNNTSEGWAPENVTVGSGGLSIVTQNSTYTSADGVSHSYKSGHIQTWNGNAGFTQALGNGLAFDYDGQPATGGTVTGLWPAYWSVGSDNSWPGTGSGGGEIDVAEFGVHQCAMTQYDVDAFSSSTGSSGLSGPPLSPSGTFIGTDHQFTMTNIGGSLTWYLDGSSIQTYGSHAATDAPYPIIDVEYPTGCGGTGSNLPLTTTAHYARVYSKVTSNACYASIPSASTIPHIGTC